MFEDGYGENPVQKLMKKYVKSNIHTPDSVVICDVSALKIGRGSRTYCVEGKRYQSLANQSRLRNYLTFGMALIASRTVDAWRGSISDREGGGELDADALEPSLPKEGTCLEEEDATERGIEDCGWGD